MAWIVDNLRYAFVPASWLPAPITMGTPADRQEAGSMLRRIDVLGRRPAAGHELLLVATHVAYDVSAGDFGAAALGVVLRPDGKVTDVAVLTHGYGDACAATRRTVQPTEAGLRVRQEDMWEGALCIFAPPLPDGAVPEDECCSVLEGGTSELSVGRDGRFQVKQTRLNLSGQFADPATGEEILIEDGWREALRLGYRNRAKSPEEDACPS